MTKDPWIRAAKLSDAPAIIDFNRRLARETENKELPEPVVRAGVEAVIGDPSRGLYFVAESDEGIVGQCSITYEWSDWRNGNFWWIQSVYVLGTWRGRGVFGRLYDYVRSQAERAGVIGLRLYVEETNRRAQEVYRRRGMARTHYQIYEVEFATHRAVHGG